MRLIVALCALTIVTSCSSGDGAGSSSVEVAVRDSSGISVWEYTEAAWNAAPEWKLSAEPLLTIGGEESDTTLDLSSGVLGAAAASVGRLLPDNRILVVAGQPAEIAVIDPTGKRGGTIGRPGQGPGEYRMVTQLMMVGGDTLLAYDAMQRKGILFGLDGSARGDRVYPNAGQLPIPPMVLGTLSDGTSIHRLDNFDPAPPAGGDANSYQLPLPILALIPNGGRYDTLFIMKGVEMYSSTMSFEGESAAIPRQVGFGVVPQLVVAPDALWFTPASTLELHRRSTGGALMQIVRVGLPARAVADADQAEYKRIISEALRRLGAMVPPALLDAEIAKLDETRFAKHFPGVVQMQLDPMGALWVNIGGSPLDSTTTWGVFGSDGALQGRVLLPKGALFAAGSDRVVVRREDPETGLIRLEVWGLTR